MALLTWQFYEYLNNDNGENKLTIEMMLITVVAKMGVPLMSVV